MQLSFPHVNDAAFIDFIYQEELVKAVFDLVSSNKGVKLNEELISTFINTGKTNLITRPIKLSEAFYKVAELSAIDREIVQLAIKAWNDAITRASTTAMEYQQGLDGLELPVLRRFRLLDDEKKYHFLVAKSKLSDLAGRQGADLFAYLDLHDGNKILYHGKNVDELKFNMFFGFPSRYPLDKLKVGTLYFDEQLQDCESGFFKTRLFSNLKG